MSWLADNEERALRDRSAKLDRLRWRMAGVLGELPGADPVDMLERILARPTTIQFEAVDGDRRVTVTVPDALAVDAHARGMFRDVAEQMFRSGRAERARSAGRVVGEAGTREDPTVQTGATSPTTEHDMAMPCSSFEVETAFGTPVVEGQPTHVDGPFIPFGSMLVEQPGGPPVQPPEKHGWRWDEDTKRWVEPNDGTPATWPGDEGKRWDTVAGDWVYPPGSDEAAELDAAMDELTTPPALALVEDDEERQASIAPAADPEPATGAAEGEKSGTCSNPVCLLSEDHDGDCEVSPIGRALGAVNGGRARGEQKAAEKAERMARFVEAYKLTDGTPTERTAAGAKAADLAVSTANRYLREARDAGLIEDVAPDRVKPATGDRAATPFRPPVRERSAPASITPPRPTPKKTAPAPPPAGERLTPKERMDRFVDAYQASTLTGDKRVEHAAKAAGLATQSGASYLRQARKAGLLPDPLGALSRAAGPITGGVA